jgi:hypothetical protein
MTTLSYIGVGIPNSLILARRLWLSDYRNGVPQNGVAATTLHYASSGGRTWRNDTSSARS